MGENYYWAPIPGGIPVHIGKSSGGWCFSLHVIPEDGIKDLDDWKLKFREPTSLITDEYDREVPVAEMLKIIEERSWKIDRGSPSALPSQCRSWGHFHDVNYSQFGPNGLLRHRISEEARCIGHGEGTWDLITGDFS